MSEALSSEVTDQRIKREEAVYRKGEVAAALARLARHPDWALLTELFTKKKDREIEMMSRLLLAGGTIDQRRLDYERGFWDGVEAILKRPENAEKRFQAALSRLANEVEAENADSYAT